MSTKLTYATVYTQGLADDGVHDAFESSLHGLRSSGARQCPHRIADKTSYAGEQFERTDPSDPERVLAVGNEADPATIAEALDAARAACGPWQTLGYEKRVAFLRGLVPVIEARRVSLAARLSMEVGKTRADAFAEVDECVAIIELYCNQIERAEGFSFAMAAPNAASSARVVYRPYGVFGVIAPFNFPMAIGIGMIVPALLTGNTVVFKPSALTPSCGDEVALLFLDLGLPPGVLNLVQGGAAAGGLLAESGVDGLVFTGSADVGLTLTAKLAQTPFIRPVLAEMGGKNAAIVTGAAGDLDLAAHAVARSAFGMSGQKCNACSRVITVGDAHDDFIERLCRAVEGLRVGDPIERSAFTGPVVSRAALNRFVASVDVAREDGRVLAGGGTMDGGHYAECTVVGDLDVGHPLAREELFVPILVATRVDAFSDALAEANAVRFGLSAGLFSDDEAEQRRFLDEIEAGIVFVNTPSGATTGVWPGSQTMAGWKGSGSTGKGGFGPYYLQQFAREQSRTIAG